jgi:hypothetical protein
MSLEADDTKKKVAEFRDPGGRPVLAVSYDDAGRPWSIECRGETWDAEWSKLDSVLYVNRIGGGREHGAEYEPPRSDPFANTIESHAIWCNRCDDWRPTDVDDPEHPCEHISWCSKHGWWRGPSPSACHPKRKVKVKAQQPTNGAHQL